MNEQAVVVVEKLVHGGSGLARLKTGQVIFVDGVLPGERILVILKQKRKGFLQADLIEVITPSPHRITPPCSGEKECTGATWQHIAYAAQLAYKQDILQDALTRIAHITPMHPLLILPSPHTDHYRLRTQFSVRTEEGTQRIGFFRHGSYSLVEVDDAFLIHPIINRTLKAIRSLVRQLPLLTEIHINATPGGQAHILLFSELSRLPLLEPFFMNLKKIVPEVIGITGYANKQKAFVIGNNRLLLELDGLTYTATEGNFYQVNWEQNKNMVRMVMDFAGLAGHETVLDLYSGIGNFALPLARKARTVIGVESGYAAIEDAKANAELNGITNVEFLADDLQKGLKALLQQKKRADVIVLDPPRSGATLKTLERILAFVPQKIIYVSCNPSTLARDLQHFQLFGFRLDRLQPVDMFPYTYHIECIAEMTREG